MARPAARPHCCDLLNLIEALPDGGVATFVPSYVMVLPLFGSLPLNGDYETSPQCVDSVGSQDDLEVPQGVEDDVEKLGDVRSWSLISF